jgi:hypothetical protein
VICLTEQELSQARETLAYLERAYTVKTSDDLRQLIQDVLMAPKADSTLPTVVGSFRLAMLSRVRILQRLVNKGGTVG